MRTYYAIRHCKYSCSTIVKHGDLKADSGLGCTIKKFVEIKTESLSENKTEMPTAFHDAVTILYIDKNSLPHKFFHLIVNNPISFV